jgi:hypothetical protein
MTTHHLLRAAIAYMHPELDAEELTAAAGRLAVHLMGVQRALAPKGGALVLLEPPADQPRHAVRVAIETADGELLGSVPVVSAADWVWHDDAMPWPPPAGEDGEAQHEGEPEHDAE